MTSLKSFVVLKKLSVGNIRRLLQSGVMGNPMIASAEKGKKMWQIMIAKMTEFVETIKNTPSDKLHQNRY